MVVLLAVVAGLVVAALEPSLQVQSIELVVQAVGWIGFAY